MKLFVPSITSFSRWLRCLATVLLPWQTRWFLESPSLLAYPWEQGRVSLYASWIVLVFAWVLTLIAHTDIRYEIRDTLSRYRIALGVAACLIVGYVAISLSRLASIMWMVSMGMAFLWLLLAMIKKEEHEMLKWLIIGFIPQVILGMAQFLLQTSWSTKWLGLPVLDPQAAGASVIFHEGIRSLRAYGGMPHPNIFGGYLAVLLLYLTQQKKTLFLQSLLMIALLFTSSRSAWLTLLFGVGVLVLRLRKGYLKQLIVFACAGIVVLMAYPWLARPVSSQATARPEQVSVSERLIAQKQVLSIHGLRMFIGTGPGAWIPYTVATQLKPLVPHAVPFIAYVETGLLGILTIMGIGMWMIKKYDISWLMGMGTLPLFLLDHYLWSYWPGHVLLACILLLWRLDLQTPSVNLKTHYDTTATS